VRNTVYYAHYSPDGRETSIFTDETFEVHGSSRNNHPAFQAPLRGRGIFGDSPPAEGWSQTGVVNLPLFCHDGLKASSFITGLLLFIIYIINGQYLINSIYDFNN